MLLNSEHHNLINHVTTAFRHIINKPPILVRVLGSAMLGMGGKKLRLFLLDVVEAATLVFLGAGFETPHQQQTNQLMTHNAQHVNQCVSRHRGKRRDATCVCGVQGVHVHLI